MPDTLTILAVDDDLEDLELIEESVLHADPSAHFKKLTEPRKLVAYLDQAPAEELPQLIILDYNMPEMTGAQLIAQLGKQPRYAAIPKVVLSTSSLPRHINECMASGAAKYFVKPDNLPALRNLAQEILSFSA